jgi:hypothetical protein
MRREGMHAEDIESLPTVEDAHLQQMEVFARELHEQYLEERRLRRELEERNGELEQRLRELSALNRAFREHLEAWFAASEGYREIIDGVQALAQTSKTLAEPALSFAGPDQPGSAPE